MTIYKNLSLDKIYDKMLEFGLFTGNCKTFKFNNVYLKGNDINICGNKIEVNHCYYETSYYDDEWDDSEILLNIATIDISQYKLFELIIDWDYFEIKPLWVINNE